MTPKPSLKLSLGFLLLTLILELSTLFAQVPSVINYQGRVQASGTNFSGTGQLKFALVSPGTNVSRQATAAATVTSGFITGITVIDGGGGYVSAPAVIITDPTGSGGRAAAQISNGAVTNIAVQNAGSGYSSSPAVTIAPPPLTIVNGTFWSNDGTSNDGSEPASAVPVPVQQGLFMLFLGDTNLSNMQSVPADVFTQSDVHLRIWFSDGTNGFAQLSPDQRLGSVGYAMKAALVSEGGVSGAALATSSVTSEKIENRAILVEDLSLSLLNGAFWNLNGNSGATPGTHFLGTTDNQPLELKVNGVRALRIEPNPNGAPNLVGGAAINFITPGVVGATIGGGGATNYLNAVSPNSVADDFGTIGGGVANTIATNASSSTIAGGESNDIGAFSSTIGGGDNNNIGRNSEWSTISGGRLNDIGSPCNSSTISGGDNNNIANGGFGGTIAGGRDNNIGANAGLSSIGGGHGNSIGTFTQSATIGGGNGNEIGTQSTAATIGGGFGNSVSTNSPHSTIGGGEGNTILGSSDYNTIGGGRDNTIGDNSQYATIPGGYLNFATNRAFAAGTRAKARHTGAFVWVDNSANLSEVPSTNVNSVTMRAAGGYRLFSNSARTLGVYLAPSGGSWTSISDRNAKENFEPVNARAVLDKVAALPLSTWNYKSQTNGIRHIGPMAQDFKAAFGVGESDIGITTVDADGVALTAIQGLNQKIEEQAAALRIRESEVEALKLRIAQLEKLQETVEQLQQLLRSNAHPTAALSRDVATNQ